MRKLTMAACATGLAIALGTGMASAAQASAAQASSVIVVGPGQSIQAAINAARPGDTVFVKPGVYHQSVQIRTNGITLRGSGAFHGGTVLVPPKHFPKTLCNGGFGPTGVCVLAKSINPKTGAVLVPVRNDTVTGLLVTGFPGNGVFGYGTAGLSVTRVVAYQRRRLRYLPVRLHEDPVRRRHRDRQRRGRVLRRGLAAGRHGGAE